MMRPKSVDLMARLFGEALSRAVLLARRPALPNPCSTLIGGDQGPNGSRPDPYLLETEHNSSKSRIGAFHRSRAVPQLRRSAVQIDDAVLAELREVDDSGVPDCALRSRSSWRRSRRRGPSRPPGHWRPSARRAKHRPYAGRSRNSDPADTARNGHCVLPCTHLTPPTPLAVPSCRRTGPRRST